MRNDAEVMLQVSFGSGVGSSVGMKNGEMADKSIATNESAQCSSNPRSGLTLQRVDLVDPTDRLRAKHGLSLHILFKKVRRSRRIRRLSEACEGE